MKAILLHRGMSAGASLRIARHFASLAREMIQKGASPEQTAFGYWVPGRIEVMGKHTDYGGGKSLLSALQRGFCLLAFADESPGLPRLTLVDRLREEEVSLCQGGNLIREPHWAIYPQTVLERGGRNFGNLAVGGVFAFRSDLPRASGMSSSSAFMIAVFLALRDLNGWHKTEAYTSSIKNDTDLADYLGHVENGQTYKKLVGEKGVGTFGGSQDHTAILCSKPRQVALCSFKPTQLLEPVAIPDNVVFCLASSGVKASKTKGARDRYNDAANRAMRVVAAWNEWKRHDAHTLAEVIRHSAFELEAFCDHLDAVTGSVLLANRLRQFHAEVTQFIPDAVTALITKNRNLLARAVGGSQEMAEIYLGNQVFETIHLAKSARALGAVAASAFGAGFGGSVWALVDVEKHAQFIEAWRNAYETAFPQHASAASFFMDATGPAAFSIR